MSNPFRPVSPASNSFLPEDYIARKTETRVNILILGLFALVLGGVVAAFVVTNQRWQVLKERQKTVNEQCVLEGQKLDQLKSLQLQRAQMLEKAEITAALVERVPRWAVLGEVSLRMPMEMRLDQLTIKSTRTDAVRPPPTTGPGAAPMVKNLTDKITGNIAVPERPKVTAPTFSYVMTIDGSTNKNDEVADFLSSLKSSPVLKTVELNFIHDSKEKDRELRKFQIVASLKTDTDTKLLAASLNKLIADRTAAINGKDKTPDKPGSQPVIADGGDQKAGG
jgi:Tfp pilus assembly protein PilN